MWSASTLVAHQPSGLCKTKYFTQASPFTGQNYRDSHDLGARSNWMPELHFSCHTGWIIWQKGWRWDLSPQTVQRGQGTRHQLCHLPFSQGQHRHHMVWLSPSRGPRICVRAKPSLEICTPRNHLVDLWHVLWKVKTSKPWKQEKSRSGWRNSII